LFSHQGGLPLGQDQNASYQVHLSGYGRDVSQGNQLLVDDAAMGVVRVGYVLMMPRVGAQDMVGDENVGIPQVFGGLDILLNSARVGANLGLRENYSELQRQPPVSCLAW
jgi:hypothetical protein